MLLTKIGAGALLLALGSAPLAAQAATPAVDPGWLRADTAARTTALTLVAGLTPANGGMNFNGFGGGKLTVTVPVGWTVTLHYKNQDQILPHSVEVIPADAAVPLGPVTPAFPRAATKALEQGVPPGSGEDVRFVATKAGAYVIFCAVPGHGQAGMWIRLTVSDATRAPSIEATTGR